MIKHDFHENIGKIINEGAIRPKSLPNSSQIRILKDKACDPIDGHIIPLSSIADVSSETKLCNADILIAVDDKAKVIIEIEESNVKPINIYGKFFASALSDQYKRGKKDKIFFTPTMLFIQILDNSKIKSVSNKGDQWNRIQSLLKSILVERLLQRKWEYELIQSSSILLKSDSSQGSRLSSIIKDFIANNSD